VNQPVTPMPISSMRSLMMGILSCRVQGCAQAGFRVQGEVSNTGAWGPIQCFGDTILHP
jgi:hypothetical protein